MVIKFDCLDDLSQDKYDFMYCLMKLKESYEKKSYLETDDICTFLFRLKPVLYEILDHLDDEEDYYAQKNVLENVFEVLITMHKKVEKKTDILEEFNIINALLAEYDINGSLKYKLDVLREINSQCKVYQERQVEEKELDELNKEDIITKEDYKFLNE